MAVISACLILTGNGALGVLLWCMSILFLGITPKHERDLGKGVQRQSTIDLGVSLFFFALACLNWDKSVDKFAQFVIPGIVTLLFGIAIRVQSRQ